MPAKQSRYPKLMKLLGAGPAGEPGALQRLASVYSLVLVGEAAEAGAIELAVAAGKGNRERRRVAKHSATLVLGMLKHGKRLVLARRCANLDDPALWHGFRGC